jgi:ribosomal protein S6
MPLYELLCLARPVLPKAELARMIARIGALVQDKGGVITDVVSYGKQPLAYSIKGVHGKFVEVSRSAVAARRRAGGCWCCCRGCWHWLVGGCACGV